MKVQKYENADQLYQQLNAIAEGERLKTSEAGQVGQLLEENLRLIASQCLTQDGEKFQRVLAKISDKINREVDTPKAREVAFEIMGIAKGLFSEGEPAPPDFPRGVWQQILSYLPPKRRGDFGPRHDGGLKHVALVSREMRDHAMAAKRRWADQEAVSMKTFGCGTAAEAVDYAIQHRLVSVNLEDFTDLSSQDLMRLIEEQPNLRVLILGGGNLSVEALQRLGTLEELRVLVMRNCNQTAGEEDGAGQLDEDFSSDDGDLSWEDDPHWVDYRGERTVLDFSRASNLAKLEIKHSFGVESLILPEQTARLTDVALESTDPATIRLPESARNLRNISIVGCQRVKRIALPKDAPKLEYFGSPSCEQLESVQFPDKSPRLWDVMCFGCTSLKEVALPKEATALSVVSFSDSENLIKLTLPEITGKPIQVLVADCPRLRNIQNAEGHQIKRIDEIDDDDFGLGMG